MTLKYKYESKEQIPVEHLPLYSEMEGAWRLNIEGAVEKAKLDEFRDHNVALLKERDALNARFAGIDPDQARAWQAEKEKIALERQKEAAEREQAIEARAAAIKADLEKQTAALAGERDALQARLLSIQIEQGIATAAGRCRVRQGAMTDITARARAVLRTVEGRPTILDADGKTTRLGKDGAPMTLEEWMDTQVSEAPHLFEAHAGGGAAGNASGGGGTAPLPARNPFRKETWNLTGQMRLQKTDPQLAARLKAAAA